MGTLKGKLKAKFDTIQVSEKYSKREFVITDNDALYPQVISFQLGQDKCSLIDNVQVGDEIEVHYNLRGREWVNPQGETKYFNTLDAWKIDLLSSNVEQPKPEQNNAPNPNDDALPF